MPEDVAVQTLDRCACGVVRARTILKAHRYATYYAAAIEERDYELRRCSACSLVRTLPRPEHSEHAPFRDESFLQPYLERQELFDALLRPTVADIVALAPPPGKFIDVGANVGAIARFAGDAGYDAVGIELNEAGVEFGNARGLDMRAVALEDAGFEPESIDVICLSATAEHIPDLAETFAVCRALLRPGGLLYVSNSPNYRSLGARMERDLWYGLQPTGHVWQFTPSTLRLVFERAGLRVVHQRTYNLHRDFGRNRKEKLKKMVLAVAAHFGLGDALSMAAIKL